jgi:hypothetical protein
VIVAVRVLLLVLGLSAVLCGVRAAYQADSRGNAQMIYVCPMHPEVKEGAPGECPLCHMALVKVSDMGTDSNAPSAEGPEVDVANLATVTRRLVTETTEVRAPAWIESANGVVAVLHDDDLCGLGPGARAYFVSSASRSSRADVHLAADPPTRRGGSKSAVRFEFDVPDAAHPVGEVGLLVSSREPCAWQVVPAAAVLESVDGPYVLATAHTEQGAPVHASDFARRPVHIGRQFSTFAVVLSGLQDGEMVIAKTAYEIDAELGPHPPM